MTSSQKKLSTVLENLILELAEYDEVCDILAEIVSLDTSDGSDSVDEIDSHLKFQF